MEPTNLADIANGVLETAAAHLMAAQITGDNSGDLSGAFPEVSTLPDFGLLMAHGVQEVAAIVWQRAVGGMTDDAASLAVANVLTVAVAVGCRIGELSALGSVMTDDDLTALLSDGGGARD
jgi:hypothetical protein